MESKPITDGEIPAEAACPCRRKHREAAEYDALKIAYSQYLTCRGWYANDYSNGVHNPTGFEKTSSIVIKRLRSATAAAKKAVAKK